MPPRKKSGKQNRTAKLPRAERSKLDPTSQTDCVFCDELSLDCDRILAGCSECRDAGRACNWTVAMQIDSPPPVVDEINASYESRRELIFERYSFCSHGDEVCSQNGNDPVDLRNHNSISTRCFQFKSYDKTVELRGSYHVDIVHKTVSGTVCRDHEKAMCVECFGGVGDAIEELQRKVEVGVRSFGNDWNISITMLMNYDPHSGS